MPHASHAAHHEAHGDAGPAPLRVAFWGTNSPTGYSGGRYHAWMMAEALASKGHHVQFITNAAPAFLEDFSSFPAHASIRIHTTPDFRSGLPEGPFDLLVIVPHRTKDKDFFIRARQFAYRSRAKLVLLNFEAGNWYNEVSPFKQDIELWDNWIECCQDGCLVLSLTRTGQEYAVDFYQQYADRISFAYSYPAINTFTADAVRVRKERQIVLITRFIDPHKGAADTGELLCPAMRGYTLVVIVGNGSTSLPVKRKLLRVAQQHGIKVVFKYGLTDAEKFEELSKAQLLLYPSRFEGYGYPPIEAQYCDTPCVAFDLPVLREVSGRGITYVPPGDYGAFRRAIQHHLTRRHRRRSLRRNVEHAANFSRSAVELDQICSHYHRAAGPTAAPTRIDPGDLPAAHEHLAHRISDFFLAQGVSKVSIYGAGRNGQTMFGLLSVCGVEVADVFDEHATGELGGRTIKRFDDRQHAEPIVLTVSPDRPGFLQAMGRLRSTGNAPILVVG